MRSRHKVYLLYFLLQKTHGYRTRYGAGLPWEGPILKTTWSFENLTSVGSRDNFRKLYIPFHETYGHALNLPGCFLWGRGSARKGINDFLLKSIVSRFHYQKTFPNNMIFFVDKKYFERDFSDFKVEFFHENISHFMKLCFIKVSFVATLIYQLFRK